MNITAVFNFLLLAGAVQGFIFIVATFLARKKIERTVLFLNLFVLFLSLNNLQSWIIDKELLISDFFLYHFRVPWYVLIVPMFYAFLIHYLGIEKKKWPFITVSAVVFILEVVVRVVLLYSLRSQPDPEKPIALYNSIEDAVTLAYSLFLFFKALRVLYKYDGLYQPLLAFDNLKWVKRFMNIGGIVIVLWFVAVLLNLFSETIKAPYSYYPLRLGSSILIYWVGYQAFFQYVLLTDRIVLRTKIRKGDTHLKARAQSELEPPRQEKEGVAFLTIDKYIIGNQRFLDPYLSMETLAKELSMGTSSLSKMVNQYAENNFSDYINSYRVEEAKKLLNDPDFASYTIVAIGLECGFNSKSTFYSAFRKFTGLTPTEYRKRAV